MPCSSKVGLVFVAYRMYIVYRQSLLGPVVPSIRALSGRLKFAVRRHKFDEDSLFFSSLDKFRRRWTVNSYWNLGALKLIVTRPELAGESRPGGNPGANRWFL